jgi:hypothetical protein
MKAKISRPSGGLEWWVFEALGPNGESGTTVHLAAPSWFEARARAAVLLGVDPSRLKLRGKL